MNKNFIFLFIFQLLFAWDGIKKQSKAWDSGVSEANSLLGDIKSNMDKRINKPLTSNQKLYTFDNKQEGYVSITCAKESNIMKIGYSTTSGGNINLVVDGDLDLDGKYEYSFNIDSISGICANGFIKCSDGTWEKCKYYLLEFNRGITYTKALAIDLSGCYCINNSCGGLSSKSKARILSDIAGTMASLLRGEYIVSNVELSNDNSYAYIKGKSINCNGESVPVGMDGDELKNKAKKASLNNESYYVIGEGAENINKNPTDSSFTDKVLQKKENIESSTKWSENAQSYSYSDNGKKVSGNIFTKDPKQIKYCEIEYDESSPDVFGDETTRASSTSSNTSKKTKIVECVENNNNWTCPINTNKGEKIKHDCGNIDNFNEVASKFSALGEAVKDFTCTSK